MFSLCPSWGGGGGTTIWLTGGTPFPGPGGRGYPSQVKVGGGEVVPPPQVQEGRGGEKPPSQVPWGRGREYPFPGPGWVTGYPFSGPCGGWNRGYPLPRSGQGAGWGVPSSQVWGAREYAQLEQHSGYLLRGGRYASWTFLLIINYFMDY